MCHAPAPARRPTARRRCSPRCLKAPGSLMWQSPSSSRWPKRCCARVRSWSRHNAKYDLEVLRMIGITVDKPVYDTMIAQFLCDPGGRGLGLKQLAFDYFGWQMTEISTLIGKGKKQISMREVPIESGRALCRGRCRCHTAAVARDRAQAQRAQSSTSSFTTSRCR